MDGFKTITISEAFISADRRTILLPDGEEQFLKYLEDNNLMQDIANNPDEKISDMRKNMEKLYKIARENEGFFAITVTLIWGFDNLPNLFYG